MQDAFVADGSQPASQIVRYGGSRGSHTVLSTQSGWHMRRSPSCDDADGRKLLKVTASSTRLLLPPIRVLGRA